MKRLSKAALWVAVVALVCAGIAFAEEEKAPDIYVYSTYNKCDLARQARADERDDGHPQGDFRRSFHVLLP